MQKTTRTIDCRRVHLCILVAAVLVFAAASCSKEEEKGSGGGGSTSALAITTTSLPDATVGASFSTPIQGAGGDAPYSWAITAGALPAGISLTGGTASQTLLSGTATAPGSFSFDVSLSDSSSNTVTVSLMLDVVYPPLVITTATLTDAVENAPYARPITASGGTGSNYMWQVISGNFPPGLSLAGAGTPSANITGTPTAAGSYAFTVEVTDSDSTTATRVLSIVVHPPLVITSSSPPNCMVTANYNFSLTATGGFGSHVWDIPVGLLPPGLAIQSSGAITGVPNTAGSYNLTLRVTESGAGTTATLPCTIISRPQLQITTTSLADGLTTQAYAEALPCTGGSGAGHTWTLVSGPLPIGLVLAASGNPGSVSGTPSKAGLYPLTLRVTDSEGFTAEDNFSLRIGALIETYAGNGQPYGPNQLNQPEAVIVDSSNNLYVADYFNSIIRKLELGTGTLTTYAGTGTAGYSGDGGAATAAEIGRPVGLALDAGGNLYFSDIWSNTVRRVDATTGVISTVAGNGGSGYSGDGGSAVQATLQGPHGLRFAGADLYIADAFNHRIRVVSGGVITTFAGVGTSGFSGDAGQATAAQLNQPKDLVFDGAGDMWICDRENNRLRRISGGVITTVCGNGNPALSGDGGQAAAAEISRPEGIALGTDGHIYFTDSYNHRVRRIHTGTGVISTIAGIGNGYSTYGYSGDGGPATAAEFAAPRRLAFDVAGNLFVADNLNHSIRRIDQGTQVISSVTMGAPQIGDGGQANVAVVGAPFALAHDLQGDLLIGEPWRIRVVNQSTGAISTLAGNGNASFFGDGGQASAAQFMLVSAMAVDAQGNIFIADSYAHRIRRIDVTSGVIDTIAGSGPVGFGQGTFAGDGGQATAARLNDPRDLALDGAGMLYIADSGNHRIRRVNLTSGVITTFAGNGTGTFGGDGGQAIAASINRPEGVCLHVSGFLLIADSFNHRVRGVNLGTGVIQTWAGSGTMGFTGDGGVATSARFSSPRRVVSDAQGQVYVADTSNHRVRRFSGLGGLIQTVAGGGATLGDGGSATQAQLSNPQALLLDTGGNLLIVDRGFNRVRLAHGP